MTELQFTKIEKGHGYNTLTSAAQRITDALEEDYETRGEATHIARTELDEVVFAYPLKDGHRLILLCPAGTNYTDDPQADCPDEFEVSYTDKELEAGISTKTALL